MLSGGPIRGRTANEIVYILSGFPMFEIDGVDVGGSRLTRAAFFPSKLLPSPLGRLSTAPLTLTAGCRYELL